MLIIVFLSSGLFLGWSLGANDAANIFGTAVGSKMLRFYTAAFIAAVFVLIGAVYAGTGTTNTLGKLGAVDTTAGAFVLALAAGTAVFLMTKRNLPVSTSQAIVGSILAWNVFAQKTIDFTTLQRVVGSWIFSPILSGILAILFVLIFRSYRKFIHGNIFARDAAIRRWFILLTAFGAFSLGSNNIANVVGVFASNNPLPGIDQLGLDGTQVLFFLGGLSIAIGIISYSQKVIKTVGNSLYKLSPIQAIIVVLSSSLTLFLFASEGLAEFLTSVGLPQIPLVPVSSSQAIVGAVTGVGLIRNPSAIKYRLLGKIGVGWLITPLISGALAYIGLFIMENLFLLEAFQR
jgi:PiT family inorganic phosphate transporter